MRTDNHSISLNEAAEMFLKQPVFGVIGLSRGQDDTAKTIYEKLASLGRTVYAIHPTETTVKSIPCYPDLQSVPRRVNALVIVTKPEHVAGILSQATQAEVSWIWMHKSFGNSVNTYAVQLGRQNGLNIIDGGCPMMHLKPVDPAHRCMKPVLQWIGRIPKRIPLLPVN